MTRFGLLICAALLAGCEAIPVQTLPDGVTAADVALFKSAVTDTNCGVTNQVEADAVKAQTGFEDAKLRDITRYLTLAGESEPANPGFRLTSGSCSNA